jgi:hypothetical protein
VKYAEKGGTKYKILTHYVHSHDVVEDFNNRYAQNNVLGKKYNYSCLDAFTKNLIEIKSQMKYPDRVKSIKLLSPSEMKKYALSPAKILTL